MSKNLFFCMTLLFMLTVLVSCSSINGSPTLPAQNNHVAVADQTGRTTCLGLWQFTAEEATGSVSLVQLRTADKMINVLGFMEPPALSLMQIDWPNLHIDFINSTIDVGIKLTHPLGTKNRFMGFDVRGVCFGPQLTNADGLTLAMSPEFFSGVPFGYQDGLLGKPNSAGNYSGLAGYKYYCDGLGGSDELSTFFSNPANLDDRGKFTGTAPHQRNYSLDWNDVSQGFLVFNYAIYANYDFPTGVAPFTQESFSYTDANSSEAFCFSITETNNSLSYYNGEGGGSISLDIEVWDWQGVITNCAIESFAEGVIPETDFTDVGDYSSTEKSYVYTFDDVPATPITSTQLDILITVTDPSTYGEAWLKDLLPTDNPMYSTQVINCFSYRAKVSGCPVPTVTTVTNPSKGTPGDTYDGVNINGAFVDGPSLGVKFKKAGEFDIIATNLFYTPTKITCSLDLSGLDVSSVGNWDVEVTNGCGTVYTAPGLFPVETCDGFSDITSSVSWGINASFTFGTNATDAYTCTRAGNTMVVGSCTSAPKYINARDASGTQAGEGIFIFLGQTPRSMTCSSTDMIYFSGATNPGTVYKVQWDGVANSWGSIEQQGDPFPSNWQVYRLKVDNTDHPIALCLDTETGSLMRIYHWSTVSSSWGDGTDIPVNLTQGAPYSYIHNFDWNPSKAEYVITRVNPSTGYCELWSVTPDGTITATLEDGDLFPAYHANNWSPGVFIDQSSPNCRLLVWGGNTDDYTVPRPVARFSGAYNSKTVSGVISNGTYGGLGTGDFGAWANDTDRFFVRCGADSYFYAILYMPSDW